MPHDANCSACPHPRMGLIIHHQDAGEDNRATAELLMTDEAPRNAENCFQFGRDWVIRPSPVPLESGAKIKYCWDVLKFRSGIPFQKRRTLALLCHRQLATSRRPNSLGSANLRRLPAEERRPRSGARQGRRIVDCSIRRHPPSSTNRWWQSSLDCDRWPHRRRQIVAGPGSS